MNAEALSLEGTTLGQYALRERIGSGGMATVYRAVQPALNRDVAVKVLPLRLSSDATFVERFKQEAVAIARLRHPNILAVFDFGEQDGVMYMVTEFVGGGTLADKLGRPWPPSQVLALATPLAAALDYAHVHGIVHRDLKPANVLLTPSGEPILSDFGLARLLQSAQRLTASGAALGTPEYMAPEQAMGEAVGPAADIYAFGVILYEMLTGAVPFPGETPVAIILAHLHQPPPPLRRANPSLSEATEAVVMQCLAKEPTDRFPSATAAIQALEAEWGERVGPQGNSFELPPSFTSGVYTLSPSATDTPPATPVVEMARPASQWLEQTVEYGELRVDLGGERLLWNGQGMERARELLRQKLERLRAEGWEPAGSLRDPGVLRQGMSLRGPTIRAAVLPVRRIRPQPQPSD